MANGLARLDGLFGREHIPLTFWGKVDSTEGLRGRVPVLTIPPPGGGKSLIFAYVDVTEPKWTRYSMTFSTPTASDGLRIRCYESTNTLNGTIYSMILR
jgi:hypothetical protein